MKSMIQHSPVRPVEIQYQPSPNYPQLLRVTRVSMGSGKTNSMDLPITEDHLRQWLKNNQLIQNVMPHLSATQREFLISGCTQEEWDALNPPEQEP